MSGPIDDQTRIENEISSTEKLLNVIRGNDEKGRALTDDPPEHRPALGFKQKLQPFAQASHVGVEILRDRVNLVEARRRRSGWQIISASSTPMPEGMDIQNPDFPLFLKSLFLKLGNTKNKKIWTFLSPAKGETWTSQVPKIKKGLSNAAYWSARKDKAFEQDQFVFDYRICGQATEKQIPKFLADASIGSADGIREYKELFSKAGLRLHGITLPTFALENILHCCRKQSETEIIAVVYIGEDASCIDIHSPERIVFSRVVRTGKDSIIDSLRTGYSGKQPDEDSLVIETINETGKSHSLSMDRNQAMEVLGQLGNKTPGKSDLKEAAGLSQQNVFEMILPALERLVRQVERTIDYSVNVLYQPAPVRIIIFGAMEISPEITDFFSNQLAIPAHTPDLLSCRGIDADPKIFQAGFGLNIDMASAAGLAMPSKNTINFLHTAFDRDREKKAIFGTNVVAAACAFLFVLIAGYWWMCRHELNSLTNHNNQLKQEIESYEPKISSEDIITLADDIKENHEKLQKLSNRLLPVAALAEISRLTPDNIYLLKLQIKNNQNRDFKTKDKTSLLWMEGFVAGRSSDARAHLAEYMIALRKSALFKTVEIQTRQASLPEDVLKSGETYGFALRLTLKEVSDAPVA
jgi:Tfp pilus assembly PilM family ATPase/Tfp pilus assembly protein PilN